MGSKVLVGDETAGCLLKEGELLGSQNDEAYDFSILLSSFMRAS